MIIVDYGVGNLASVHNMVKKVGGTASLSSDYETIANAKKIILPGVGAFDHGVNALKEKRLDDAIKQAVDKNGAKLLGICLGMQLLFESSEEGRLPGLGLIKGSVKKFNFEQSNLKIPHMGWNKITPVKDSLLFRVGQTEQRFYFVHSFYVSCTDISDITATSSYGSDFTCAVERGSVFGAQFHPEKSHKFGMDLMRRFVKL